MGLQDVFFTLRLPFDGDEARELSTRLSEEVYLTALEGDLQPDLWGIVPTQSDRWAALRERVAEHGLRNSLLVAIAPTATIASIAD